MSANWPVCGDVQQHVLKQVCSMDSGGREGGGADDKAHHHMVVCDSEGIKQRRW